MAGQVEVRAFSFAGSSGLGKLQVDNERTADFEIEQWVDAPIEQVFAHFTVAENLVTWHGVAAEVDAQPGGAWWCRFEDGSVVRGQFVEIDPPRRLVFTWGFDVPTTTGCLVSKTPAGSSRVEVTLHAGPNRTRVHLRHLGFVEGDSVAVGWTHFLGRLATKCKY